MEAALISGFVKIAGLILLFACLALVWFVLCYIYGLIKGLYFRVKRKTTKGHLFLFIIVAFVVGIVSFVVINPVISIAIMMLMFTFLFFVRLIFNRHY